MENPSRDGSTESTKKCNTMSGDSNQDSNLEKSQASREENPKELEIDNEFINGIRLYFLVASLCLAVFLAGLDWTIIATAVPTITSVFDSLEDVGWYGSAFTIAVTAFQPLVGRIFQLFSQKWSFLGFVAAFEVGSLICALAPNSHALIVGRAIAGIGASGLLGGSMILISTFAAPNFRAGYTGMIFATFAVGNILGPVVGGAFTENVTWRWCFYINLPIGAVTVLALVILLQPKVSPEPQDSVFKRIIQLDLIGFSIFSGAVIMLLLALLWGGEVHPWDSQTVVGLFCGSGVAGGLFIWWQWYMGDAACIPFSIYRETVVTFAFLTALFGAGGIQAILYYLPIWFQVVQGASPASSGVRYLPTVISDAVVALVAGGLVSKFGHPDQYLLFGLVLFTTGSGLLTTLQVDSSSGHWIGYQILCGVGFALVGQMPMIAIQRGLDLPKIPIGTAVVIFAQFGSSAIYLAIAQAIFHWRLEDFLSDNLPISEVQRILGVGATDVRSVTKPEYLTTVLEGYNMATTRAIFIAVAGGCVAFFGALGIAWARLKSKRQPM